MNKNWYYNSFAFRLASPLLLGIVVYLLVLLFFDSVNQLATNFFSREVFFVIILTLIFLEINRLVIIFLRWAYPLSRNIQIRIIIQLLTSIILSTSIISLVMYFYFVQFEGFSTITTELITFNLIYIFVAICYNLYYFSLVFLYKRNDAKINEESTKKATLELEMETFKNQVNPDFLFQSLEIIISELYRNKKRADELVNSLAMVYRNTLENKDADLIPVATEIESLVPVLKLFKAKYHDGLEYLVDNGEKNLKSIIPGTLQILFENAIFQNIISDSLKLKFKVEILGDKILIVHSLNKRLRNNTLLEERVNRLKNAYSYFSKEGITFTEINGFLNISVPLLEFDEE
ncbi:MAG: histidine kinase [Bacteroidetes bacterium]|nr:histidine kinase [Bacteroidota bacterium]